jgi:RNA polymerase-binding transcription factor DksA
VKSAPTKTASPKPVAAAAKPAANAKVNAKPAGTPPAAAPASPKSGGAKVAAAAKVPAAAKVSAPAKTQAPKATQIPTSKSTAHSTNHAAVQPAAKPTAKTTPVKPAQTKAAASAAAANAKPAATMEPKGAAAIGRAVGGKGGSAIPAKAPTKADGKSAGKSAAGAASPAPAGKVSALTPSKSEAKDAASEAKGEAKGASKGAGKNAAKGDAKGDAKASSADAAAPKAAAPKSASKSAPKKKGPIDLATAKSVAAVAAASQADSSGYVVINGRRVRMISTKGLPAPKRTKVVVEKEVEKPDLQIAQIKTKLTKKELDEYRALLLLKRRQLVGMLSGMEDEALRSSGGNLSTMPLHMADIGTDTFDQDFTLGMAETERALLDEIDAAIGRIEDKTYGVCQLTGKPIPKTRLEAKPWAKYSIEAAKILERSGSTR